MKYLKLKKEKEKIVNKVLIKRDRENKFLYLI